MDKVTIKRKCEVIWSLLKILMILWLIKEE